MNPAWASCYGDIRGVYDPPIALTQVASVKAPQMTDSIPATIEATRATPASAPSQPAAETSVAIVLPDNLPSDSIDGSKPQASQLSEHGQNVGGIVASVLGGAKHSKQADEPSADRGSQTGIAKGSSDDLPSDSAAGASGNSPQGSRPSGPGSGQAVGGIVAAILGGAGPSNGAGASWSDHVHQDFPQNEWNSEPTRTSDSVDSSHHPSAVIPESGVAPQDPTTQKPGGQAAADSGSSSTLSAAHEASISASSLKSIPAISSDSESGVDKPASTEGSVGSPHGGSDDSSSVAASASAATDSSSGGERKVCSIPLLLAVSGLIVSHML